MISSLELARICGVSQGTVDRALHGRGEISAATKERILKAARKYGYRPNPLVHELLSGKSRTVGALIPSINSIFFLDLLNAIKAELRGSESSHASSAESSFRMLISPVVDTREFMQSLEDFAARRCSAVLAVPPEEGVKIPATLTREMKLIALVSPCKGSNVWFITPDEEQTGRDAVEYLFERGHRRIVHLTYTRKAFGVLARAKGYRLAMQERGLKPLILPGPDDARILDTVRSGATALFCHNDWLAISAVRVLEKNGVRVPQDVSVLGVDASPTFRALHADITTMQYPFTAVARQSAELIRTGAITTHFERFHIVEGATVATLRY
jgi:DNA-binding LacI/PurR family transcriptional regulator